MALKKRAIGTLYDKERRVNFKTGREVFKPCRIHGRAHDDRECKVQKELLDRAVEEHQKKRRKYEDEKMGDQAKKFGFKNEAHMRSFFMSSIVAYKKKREHATLSGKKHVRSENFNVEHEEIDEIRETGTSGDTASHADEINDNEFGDMTLSDLDDEIEEAEIIEVDE